MEDSETGARSFETQAYVRAGAIVAAVAFVPFLRMALRGESFFLRDLAGQFLPTRRFVLEGLLGGQWRFWNPLEHEGEPVLPSPLSYLPDLLQVLAPTEAGISLLLALHIPFAAVAFLLLARELKLSPTASAGGALVYALGGFSLSTINLYVYAQTLAWAPLMILGLRRAIRGDGWRAVGLAALATGVTVSTMGLELVVQATLIGLLLTPPTTLKQWVKAVSALGLGACAAAFVVLPVMSLGGGSQRASGFPTNVVLGNSVYPLSLVQVLVSDFFGDTSNLTGTWWGVNFFENGFPYFLSLYLGPTVVALGLAGALSKEPLRKRLAIAVGLAVFMCMGQFAGWRAFFDLSPALRILRFPVKAFYTAQFGMALLLALSLHTLGTSRAFFMKTARIAATFGMIVASLRLVPIVAPAWTAWFLTGFLPPQASQRLRFFVADTMTQDALMGGLVALAAAAICWLAYRERLPPVPATGLLVALAAADLVRSGAGLNATVTPAFFELSPEMAKEAATLRAASARIFSCHVEASPSYWRGREARPYQHEAFSLATLQETLSPATNLPHGIRTALERDRTGFIPETRLMPTNLVGCLKPDLMLPHLERAGVSHLISLEPLASDRLRLLSAVQPKRIEPLTVHVYAVEGAPPRFDRPVTILRDEPGHLAFRVDADAPDTIVVREAWARGWEARVNGSATPLAKSGSGHQMIPVSAGANEVVLDYVPPGLLPGLAISALAVAISLGLIVLGPRRAL